MSPVNDEVPEPEPPPIVRAFMRGREVIGASDRMPVRVLVYFVIIAVCMTLAPTPANIIGVAAIALLAIDIAQHRR